MTRTTVAVRPHPFRLERELVEIAPGLTVAEIVERVLPQPWRPHAVVVIDGAPLDRDAWHIRPTPGQIVTVTVCPGSRDVLARLGTLAVTVAAVALGQYLGAAFQFGPVAKAALTAGLTAAGHLAVYALVPPPRLPHSSGRRRGPQSWALEHAGNDARLWSVIPRVLGRIRYTPPLAGQPIPELSGDDQHLRLALCWGYGPLEVTDIQVGETPLSQYQHDHEYWPGTPGIAPQLSTWSADVATELVDVVVREADPPPVRRSAPGATEVIVQLEWPRGLVDLGSGTRDDIAVEIAIDTAPVGTTTWTERVRATVRAKSTSAVRRAYRIPVSGQVDVRVRRITRDRRDAAKVDETRWAYLQTLQAGQPITARGVAISVIRIVAGPQSSGALQPISGIVTSILPDWTGSSWVERPTRNPASLALAVLRGPGAIRPVPDERIDWAAFRDWHGYCAERQLTCDLVVDWDGATVGEVLDIVAACGDAIVRPIDGRWTPIIDRPQPGPVQLLTPRNTSAISWSRSLAPLPDGLRIKFLDASSNYRPSEVTIWREGVQPTGPVRIDDLELQGVTSRELAVRHGWRRLAELELRRETWTVQVGWEYLACRPGDRVALAHDAILVSLGAGRIIALERDTTQAVTAIELDEPVDLPAGGTYGVTIRRPDGVTTHALAPTSGTVTRLPLATPIGPMTAPSLGDLVVVGELGRETIAAVVARIRPADDWSAALELVPYDERLYDPGPPPRGSAQHALGSITPPAIRAVERSVDGVTVVMAAGQRVPVGTVAIDIGWTAGSGEAIASAAPDATAVSLSGVPRDLPITVRARWRLVTGVSAWSAATTSAPESAGRPLPPRGVTLIGDQLQWSPSLTPGVIYRVRWAPPGRAYEHSTVLGATTGTALRVDLGIAAAELWVEAVTADGVTSEPVHLRWSAPPPTGIVEIWSRSERAAGWPGWLTDGSRLTGQITGTRVLGWWPDADAPAWPDPEGPFAADASTGPPWRYVTTIELPTTTSVHGTELEVTASDVVMVRPAVASGEIRRLAIIYDDDVVELPWADDMPWEGGTYWRSVAASPLIEWPRHVDARPGALLHLVLEGSGTCADIIVTIGRAVRRQIWPALEVPTAGATVVVRGAALVMAAHATARDPGVIVSVGHSGPVVTVAARDGSGAVTATTVDLVAEYV